MPHLAEKTALRDAIRRCHQENHPQFRWYGARGIVVADEWRGRGGFERFLEHIGPSPDPKLTLDRIDNDHGYVPGNVRWPRKVQHANRSDNVRIAAFGREQTVAEWAAELGIPQNTIRQRLGGGWSPEQALRTDYDRAADRRARERAEARRKQRLAALAR